MTDNTTASHSMPEVEDKVLLVDDNTTNLQLLHETLDGLGYKLLIAKNGQTALAIAQKAGPSLILLDIMMPEMDGYEVCRRVAINQLNNVDDSPTLFDNRSFNTAIAVFTTIDMYMRTDFF